MILMPIIVCLVAALILFAVVVNSFSTVASGGNVDTGDVTDYAYGQYIQHFGNTEDSILFAILVDEDCSSGYYINMVGYHLNESIYNLFYPYPEEIGEAAGEPTYSSIYLGSDIIQTVNDFRGQIEALGLSSSFTCNETSHEHGETKLINKTNFQFSESAINDSLAAFKSSTGISIAVVIEDIDDAVDRKIDMGSIIVMIICLAVIGFAIYSIVRAVREKNNRSGNDGFNNNNNGYNNNGYNNGGNNNNNNYNSGGY